MIEKFKTLFFVKSSLVSLYLALTIPLPFISIEKLKIPLTVYEVLTLVYIINASKLDVDYFILETGALWKHKAAICDSFPWR